MDSRSWYSEVQGVPILPDELGFGVALKYGLVTELLCVCTSTELIEALESPGNRVSLDPNSH